jgi:hypothetical protein
MDLRTPIWILGGGWAIYRGWSHGRTWLIIVGVVCIAIAAGLFALRRTERLRKWEPTVNFALLIVVVVALMVVFAIDILR